MGGGFGLLSVLAYFIDEVKYLLVMPDSVCNFENDDMKKIRLTATLTILKSRRRCMSIVPSRIDFYRVQGSPFRIFHT